MNESRFLPVEDMDESRSSSGSGFNIVDLDFAPENVSAPSSPTHISALNNGLHRRLADPEGDSQSDASDESDDKAQSPKDTPRVPAKLDGKQRTSLVSQSARDRRADTRNGKRRNSCGDIKLWARHSGDCGNPEKSGRGIRRKKMRYDKVVCLLDTKYDVLWDICQTKCQWRVTTTSDYDFDIFWCDHGITADLCSKFKTYQKVNHFVGMQGITRKISLGRNLIRLRKHFPQTYNFFPDTWILPSDAIEFKNQFNYKKKRTFIIKPDNGYQGKGIYLARSIRRIDFMQPLVAQRYLSSPFLLDGCKFDLRLYVLVTGCDPLRIFLHEKGLVRLATDKYKTPTNENIDNSMMHLTNYAINSKSPQFMENCNPNDPQCGHKRSWQAVLQKMQQEGYDIQKLQAGIEDIIIKTLISIQPSLAHASKACHGDDVNNSMSFEILGFDIMLDSKLKPWLIEVNQSPSFATESQLDLDVKSDVVKHAFAILNPNPDIRRCAQRDRRQLMEQRALGIRPGNVGCRSDDKRKDERERRDVCEETAAQSTGYKRLYPLPENDTYKEYIEKATEIWEMMTGPKSKRDDTKNKDDVKKGAQEVGCAKKKDPEAKRNEDLRKIIAKLTASVHSGNISSSALTDSPSAKIDEMPSEESPTLSICRLEEMFMLDEPVTAMDDARECDWSEHSNKKSSSQTLCSEQEVEGSSTNWNKLEKVSLEKHPNPNRRKMPSIARNSHMTFSFNTLNQARILARTNFGWERVTVTNRYINGKMDILFEDGQVMLKVLPHLIRFASNTPSRCPVSRAALSSMSQPVMRQVEAPPLNPSSASAALYPRIRNPSIIPTNPSGIPTNPSSITTNPSRIPTNPSSIPTNPSSIPTSTRQDLVPRMEARLHTIAIGDLNEPPRAIKAEFRSASLTRKQPRYVSYLDSQQQYRKLAVQMPSALRT